MGVVELIAVNVLGVVVILGVSFCKMGGSKLVGVGGTGRANCAAKFGTKGRLGPELEDTDTVLTGVVDCEEAQAVFCSSCFKSTFCESSILFGAETATRLLKVDIGILFDDDVTLCTGVFFAVSFFNKLAAVIDCVWSSTGFSSSDFVLVTVVFVN